MMIRRFRHFFCLLTLLFASIFPAFAGEAARHLENKLRKQLDVMFFSDQYLLDVQKRRVPLSPQSLQSPNNRSVELAPLPGLAFSQRTPEVSDEFIDQSNTGTEMYDVFLIVDSDVSTERARLAEELLQRVMSNLIQENRANLQISRKPIARTLPEKDRSPSQPENDSQNAKRDSDSKNPTEKNDQPPPPKGLFQLIQENPGFYSKALVVLWAALASLLAVASLFRRFAGTEKLEPKLVQQKQEPRVITSAAGQSFSDAAPAAQSRRAAATKDEIYSQDQATLKLIEETVNESKAHPEKTAKILESWLSRSHQNARYAQIFLRNCDIKTIEDVCKNLHPTDIEMITSTNFEMFDPFSEENLKVLEQMRHEFARRASQVVNVDKPDPLEFARTLSESDWMHILTDFDAKKIATVLTQIKPNRLNALFAKVDPSKLEQIVEHLSTIKQVTLPELERLGESIRERAETLSLNLVTEESLASTTTQLILQTRSPAQQIVLAKRVLSENSDLYKLVRSHVLLISDLNFMTARTIKALCQTIDADTLGLAFANLNVSIDRAAAFFPAQYKAVFDDYCKQTPSASQQEDAWRRVSEKINDMTKAGLISDREIHAAKMLADSEAIEPSSLKREASHAA